MHPEGCAGLCRTAIALVRMQLSVAIRLHVVQRGYKSVDRRVAGGVERREGGLSDRLIPRVERIGRDLLEHRLRLARRELREEEERRKSPRRDVEVVCDPPDHKTSELPRQ